MTPSSLSHFAGLFSYSIAPTAPTVVTHSSSSISFTSFSRGKQILVAFPQIQNSYTHTHTHTYTHPHTHTLYVDVCIVSVHVTLSFLCNAMLSLTSLSFYEPCLFLCLLYTSPSPRDRTRSRMPSSALKNFFLMIRRPPRSTPKPSSAASDVYKRQMYSERTCYTLLSV